MTLTFVENVVQATPFERQQLRHAFEAFNRQSGLPARSRRDLALEVEALTRKLNTEQSRRLDESRQAERLDRQLKQLLESLPGGVIVLGGDGEILQNNSEASRLLGRPLLGCSWALVAKREMRAGGAGDGDIELRDGRWIALSRRALPDDGGEIILVSDVTRSRRMAEIRQRKERLSAIGKMTAEFAHQVRSPLAAAMLHAARLDTADAGQQRTAQKISECLGDLGRMVDDMLQFAAGSRAPTETVNVFELVESAVDAVDGQLGHDTRVSFLVSDHELAVHGNADALRGAIVNLITNADQAAASDARIVVSGRRIGERICISVSDNGPGIDDAVLPRVFEPFFTTRPQGTGLGLAVVRQVAEAHGGAAKVTSSPWGSSFSLELPEIAGND